MDVTGSNLSDIVSSHIANTQFSDLSPSTVLASKRALLDGLGVMMAASGSSPDILPFLDIASPLTRAQLSLSAPINLCKIIGMDAYSNVGHCAFVNGAMAHALDFEDAFDAAPCHPNAASLAAVLALAQTIPNLSGERLLSAIAIGCDLVCRLGLSLTIPMEKGGWYPPPILGAMGATAACAHLLGLCPIQTKSALSIILCQTTMPGEIKYSHQTNLRAVREAFGAQSAINAVLLARAGTIGFETPLEGKAGFYALFVGGGYDPKPVLDDLGQKFYIDDLTFKAWPACRGTHAYIELALDWRGSGGNWREIKSVMVTTGPIHDMLVEPVPSKQNPCHAIDAKFSIPFTLATALVKGRVGLDDFGKSALESRQVLDLTGRIEYQKTTMKNGVVPSPFGGEIVIKLLGGETWHGLSDPALGHPLRPLSDQQILEKFTDCAARSEQYKIIKMSERTKKIQTLSNIILNIDQHEKINQLISLL